MLFLEESIAGFFWGLGWILCVEVLDFVEEMWRENITGKAGTQQHESGSGHFVESGSLCFESWLGFCCFWFGAIDGSFDGALVVGQVFGFFSKFWTFDWKFI